MQRVPSISLFALSVLLLVLTACDSGIGKRPVVSDDDPELTAAWEAARSSFDGKFLAEYNKVEDAEGVGFVAQVAFGEGDIMEHLWVSNVIQVENGYEGLIDTQPNLLKGVKKNEMKFFRLGQVTDWMFVREGVMVGGRTIQLERSRMEPDARAQFDEAHPFKFPPLPEPTGEENDAPAEASGA